MLSKAEQVQVNGGARRGCPPGMCGGWPGFSRPYGDDGPPKK
jgi:hypothetical protein